MSDRITFSVPYCFLKVDADMSDLQTPDSFDPFDGLLVVFAPHLSICASPTPNCPRPPAGGHPSIRGEKKKKTK